MAPEPARLALSHPADANVGVPDVRQPRKGQCADPCLVLVQKKPSATQDRSDRDDDGSLDGWDVDGATSPRAERAGLWYLVIFSLL